MCNRLTLYSNHNTERRDWINKGLIKQEGRNTLWLLMFIIRNTGKQNSLDRFDNHC